MTWSTSSAGNEPLEYPWNLKWDSEHTREVKMVYVNHAGTTGTHEVLSSAPSIWVCKECGRSRELCACEWRGKQPEVSTW